MEEWWRRFGEYYVLAKEIAQLDAAADAEAEAVWKLLGLDPGAKILDAPCGFGRHAVRLATWGFDVWGIDVDTNLIAQARERAQESGIDIRLDEGDLRNLPVPDGWANAVLNLSSSIGMFESEHDNQKIFSEASRVLAPGGVFVIESTHRDREARRTPSSSFAEREGTLILHERALDMDQGRLTSNLTIVDPDGSRTELSQRPRVYAISELLGELTNSGFATATAHCGWRGDDPDLDERVIVVAKKP